MAHFGSSFGVRRRCDTATVGESARRAPRRGRPRRARRVGSSRVVRHTRCSGSAPSCRAIVSSRRGVLTSRIAVSSRRRVATDTSWLDSAPTRRCTARLARVTWSACAATRGRSDANDDHDDDHDKRRRQPHAIARGVRGGHGDGHPLLADERPHSRPILHVTFLVAFMCMGRKNAEQSKPKKLHKKIIYYSSKRRGLSALSYGPGPLLLLFPPLLPFFFFLLLFPILFSSSSLFFLLSSSFPFLLILSPFFPSRISIKHRKGAGFR